MANMILSQQKLWFGGHDLTGVLNVMAIEHGIDLKENTTFGDNTRSQIPGVKSVAGQIEGFFDPVASDAALFGNLGLNNQPLSIAPAGSSEGGLGYFFKAVQGSYQVGAAHGEVMAFSASAAGQGLDLARGTIMHDAARTATANGTGRQLGAAAAGQTVHAALHVTAAAGTAPTLDVTVESDDGAGFASPTTRLSFAQKTAAAGEYLTLAGPVTDDYWRIAWSIGGTNPNFTFTVFLAIQ